MVTVLQCFLFGALSDGGKSEGAHPPAWQSLALYDPAAVSTPEEQVVESPSGASLLEGHGCHGPRCQEGTSPRALEAPALEIARCATPDDVLCVREPRQQSASGEDQGTAGQECSPVGEGCSVQSHHKGQARESQVRMPSSDTILILPDVLVEQYRCEEDT